MSSQKSQLEPLTLKQKFILVAVVPLICLLLLEGGARLLLVCGIGAPKKDQPSQLEMPTWMLQDANALARRKPSAAALDWLSMFVSGDGYRVHLQPNSRREVQNTFSLIAADQERKYTIAANSLGFRSPEFLTPKPKETFRIAVFGDSSSFGWGVNYEESWGALLQSSLQKEIPSRVVEVINFAIPGDSSAYGKLLFDTFAPAAEADLFIFGFGANDAKPVLTSHTDQVRRFQKNSSLLGIAQFLKYSAIVTLFERALTRRATPTAEELQKRVPAVKLNDYGQNLASMATQARQLGAENSLLLTLCTPANYAKRARGVARTNRLLWFNGQSQLVKALPEIRKGSLYPEYVRAMKERYPEDLASNKLFYITSDGCHPNELGHRFVADRLTKIVAPIIE